MKLAEANGKPLITLSKEDVCKAISLYIQDTYHIPEPTMGAMRLGIVDGKLSSIVALIDMDVNQLKEEEEMT